MGTTLSKLDSTSDQLDSLTLTLPKCGHTFTVETLDGICEMSTVYSQEITEGLPGRWLGLKTPPTGFQKPPTCPTCRAAITSPRYGRIFKRADLDVLEQNSAAQMSLSMEKIRHIMVAWDAADIEKRLGEAAAKLKADLVSGSLQVKGKGHAAARRRVLNEQREIPIFTGSLDPTLSELHTIPTFVSKPWKNAVASIMKNYEAAIELSKTRSAHTDAWESAFSHLFREEMENLANHPEVAPSDPEEHALRMTRMRIGQPKPLADKRFVVEAFWATVEMRLILAQLGRSFMKALSHSVLSQQTSHMKTWASFVHFILESCVSDAERAHKIAYDSKALRQMTRATLLILRSTLERARFSVEAAQQSGALKKAGVRAEYVDRVDAYREEAGATYIKALEVYRMTLGQEVAEKTWLEENLISPASVLFGEWDMLAKSLKQSTVYEPVSLQEKISIIKAFNFSHTGHFYNCPNGHPFVIGECGGAMEQAVCPECGSPVGGSNHTLHSSNSRATEMEDLARQTGSQSSPWAWGA
jgi:hypothetical protein